MNGYDTQTGVSLAKTAPGKLRCSEAINTNGCPLLQCRIGTPLIRVQQHIPADTLTTDLIPSSKSDPDRPSLLDLPREIRDAIYECLIPTDRTINLSHLAIDFPTQTTHWHPRTLSPERAAEFLPLLCVSKQIHHELATRFFTGNTIRVHAFAESGPATDPDTLAAFGFAGLLPLHPAYTKLVPHFNLLVGASDESTDHFLDLDVRNPDRPQENEAPDHTLVPASSVPAASATDTENFLQSTQTRLDTATSCNCPAILPSPSPNNPGTYELTRPDSRRRETCKAATWKEIEAGYDNDPRRLREGRPRQYRAQGRNKCGHQVSCWWVLLVVAAVPVMLPYTLAKDKMKEWRKERERERALRERGEGEGR